MRRDRQKIIGTRKVWLTIARYTSVSVLREKILSQGHARSLEEERVTTHNEPVPGTLQPWR